jgi:hypothetical protein
VLNTRGGAALNVEDKRSSGAKILFKDVLLEAVGAHSSSEPYDNDTSPINVLSANSTWRHSCRPLHWQGEPPGPSPPPFPKGRLMPAGGISFMNVTIIDSSKRPFAKFVDPAGFNDISGTFNVINSEGCNYYIAGPRTPGDINISCFDRAVKSDDQVTSRRDRDWRMFQAWQREFGIQYTSEASLHRFSIFQANLRLTAAQDEANRYAKFGLDEFADLTPDEFSQQMLSPELNAEFARHNQTPVASDDSDSNEKGVTIDWRKKGVVTAVKNQGKHGTCWAFSVSQF